MAIDVVPQLQENIAEVLGDILENNDSIKRLNKKLETGEATYADAHAYSIAIGDAVTDALGQNITSDTLPDGKMYYNIAQRVLTPLLKDDFEMVANYTAEVQKSQNLGAGIGLNAVKAELNADRIEGIVEKVSNDEFDKVSWVLGEPIVTFSESVVDDTLKANCQFQSKAGLKPQIRRRSQIGCCSWCSNLEGVYEYPHDVPDDIYRRHERCRCLTEYVADGILQNVWTKAKNIFVPQNNNNNVTKGDLVNGTTLIKKAMSSNEYNEFIDMLNSGDANVKNLFANHADELNDVYRLKGGGNFYPDSNVIDYDLKEEKRASKFSTLIHEYAHYFDNLVDFTSKLTYKELDAVRQAVGDKASGFGIVASSSDEYLKALRADALHIKNNFTQKDVDAIIGNRYSTGVQDGIDGLFIYRTEMGHGSKYYTRRFNDLMGKLDPATFDYPDDKRGALKTVYEGLGFDVDDAVGYEKTQLISRNYDGASELFANQISALAVNSQEELELMNKFFPNTMAELKRILSL